MQALQIITPFQFITCGGKLELAILLMVTSNSPNPLVFAVLRIWVSSDQSKILSALAFVLCIIPIGLYYVRVLRIISRLSLIRTTVDVLLVRRSSKSCLWLRKWVNPFSFCSHQVSFLLYEIQIPVHHATQV